MEIALYGNERYTYTLALLLSGFARSFGQEDIGSRILWSFVIYIDSFLGDADPQ